MASIIISPPDGLRVENGAVEADPFASNGHRPPHRYSSFDTQLFSLYASNSPTQAKRALEAHLADTERRIQEASKLGTTLLQQKKDLESLSEEVQQKQEDNEVGPELQKKLSLLEREYNELARETTRAFIPKSRMAPNEPGLSSPSALVFNGEAQHSPSKMNVPSRKQRNQTSNRVHDIEFATEISTSLLAQVRHLQAILVEKDETLKTMSMQKSQLESDAEGFAQMRRAMEDSEHRYKDENWNLETQVQNLTATVKDAAEREQRLHQSIVAAKAEKSTVQRDLEELAQTHGKLNEDNSLLKKQNELELSALRREAATSETERYSMQKKIEDLVAQNEGLAKGLYSRMRSEEQALDRQVPALKDDEDEDLTAGYSPPPSPVKEIPRHGALNAETTKATNDWLKRDIQRLKNVNHRERTEKLELKRMLRDARDELENFRKDGGAGRRTSADRRRKGNSQQDVLKRPLRPDQLGGIRTSQSDVILDEEDWEDNEAVDTPSKAASTVLGRGIHLLAERADTANDTDAFETANERDATTTETEAFETGVESMGANSSDELTETEITATRGKQPNQRPQLFVTGKPNDRYSFQSTASTSDEEDADAYDLRTPPQNFQPRYKLKIGRAGQRRSARTSSGAFDTDANHMKDSPASFVSTGSEPGAAQTLFAELADINGGGSEDGSIIGGTPDRFNLRSPESSPDLIRKPSGLRHQAPWPLQQVNNMVDAGVMTEPWQPDVTSPSSDGPKATLLDKGSGDRVLVTSASNATLLTAAFTKSAANAAIRGVSSTYPPGSMRDEGLRAQDDPANATPGAVTTLDDTYMNARESDDGPSESQPPVSGLDWALSSIQSLYTEPVTPSQESPSHLPTSVLGTPAERSVQSRFTESSRHIPKQIPKSGMVEDQEISGSNTTPSFVSSSSGTSMQTLAYSSVFSESIQPVEPLPVPLGYQFEDAVQPAFAVDPSAGRYAHYDDPFEGYGLHPGRADLEGSTSPAPLSFSPLSWLGTDQPTPIAPLRPRKSLPVEDGFFNLSQGSAFSAQDQPIPGVPNAKPGIGFFKAIADQDMPHSTDNLQSMRAAESYAGNEEDGNGTSFLDDNEEQEELDEQYEQHHIGAMGPAYDASILNPTLFKNNGSDDAQKQRLRLAAADEGAFERWREQLPGHAAKPLTPPMTDEGTQTMVSSEEIEELLREKQRKATITPPLTFPYIPSQSPSKSMRASQEYLGPADLSSAKTTRRGSLRKSQQNPPPLPPDHREVIAAAAQLAPVPVTPAYARSPSPVPPGLMGPPPLPASAYRPSARPRTPPNEIGAAYPQNSASRGGTTPRARMNSTTARYDGISPITHRSSASSFASELDERFNIGSGPGPIQMPADFGAGNIDPRMIQAITQTMIGEYLWKYTRKAGRGEISEKRHKRFFWVHPYTRTLYWSEQDPSMAGRAEMRAKSVAIEAVRVVTDGNLHPPGLCNKSLVVVTPGRTIQFTAATAQRHETWFNALSYLLLKTSDARGVRRESNPGGTTGAATTGTNGDFTAEDVNEFNPQSGSRFTFSRRSRSRASLASRFSGRTASPHKRAGFGETPSLAQRQNNAVAQHSEPPRQYLTTQGSISGRLSSLSGMFKSSSIRGSFSSMRSRQSAQQKGKAPSIAGASAMHDSAEDLRAIIERQEREADRIENVRACCDGKHDVGSLARRTPSSLSNRHNHALPHAHPRPHGPESHYHHEGEMEAGNFTAS